MHYLTSFYESALCPMLGFVVQIMRLRICGAIVGQRLEIYVYGNGTVKSHAKNIFIKLASCNFQ